MALRVLRTRWGAGSLRASRTRASEPPSGAVASSTRTDRTGPAGVSASRLTEPPIEVFRRSTRTVSGSG